LGTAPFAWDLPEPGPAPQPRPRKPRIWPWVALGLLGTLGALTVVGGVLGLWVGGNYDDLAEDRSYAPVAEAELQDRYKGEVGGLVVDLRGLPELDEPRDVAVEGGIGPVTVFLPGDVPVVL